MTEHVRRMVGEWRMFSLAQSLTLLVLGVVCGVCGLWVADTTPPLTPLAVEPVERVVSPGGTLRIRYDVERYRSCASRIDRILYDADRVRYTLEDLDYAASPGLIGRETFVTEARVPAGFAQGPAIYRVITRYECNLMHRLWPIVLTRDIPFEVRGPAPIGPLPIPIRPMR